MPLRLTFLESFLARLNILPSPLLDTPLAAGIAKVLITACELGVFDALSKRPLPLNILAECLQTNPQGLQLLLQLLVCAGYLHLSKGKYRNTRMTQRWLTADSPVSIASYILHSPDIVAIWNHLPEVVQTNQQTMCMPYAEEVNTEAKQLLLARHYAGLASLATAFGREVVNRVAIPHGATQLLDVGGSHAAYSAMFCRKYPRLQATIVDIQPGIDAGLHTAKHMKLDHCMHFTCADIVKDDFSQQFPEQFDVVLYFHIAHLLQPEVNQAVLAKVAKTLKPGAMFVFVDQVSNQAHGSRLASLMVQFMALTMTICGGTCYPFPTVKEWLERVGIGQVKSHRLLTPGATLITGIKRNEK